jgi:hypothetical protein
MSLGQVWSRVALRFRESRLSSSWELFWPRGATKTYALAAFVALAVPWIHEYPAGIDLPHHVHLFGVLANYGRPESAYGVFYRVDFFTPYAIVYLLAWVLAKMGGALFAVKMLISLVILMLPATMTRWLRVIGGKPSLGILGFVLVFGYGYLWGFLSFVLAASFSFVYLVELHELFERPSWRQRLICSLLTILLFFTHGIAFGFTMVAGGIACLLRRNWKAVVLDALHFVPVVLVIVPWRLKNHHSTSAGFDEPPTVERFTSLFSGAVSSQADFFPAVCALAAVCVFFAVARPRLSYEPIRLVPFALGVVGLFAMPEWASDTFLVGTRFVQFVYFYGVGAFDFLPELAPRRRVQWVTTALVFLGLGSFHYRMHVFNDELDGLDAIKALIPPGEDVRVFAGNAASASFGSIAMRNAGAYVTAAQGGFLALDSSMYFQIPVKKRKEIPEVGEYQHWIARGSRREARDAVGKEPRLIASRGHFHLFEADRTVLQVPGLVFVRFGQSWRRPRQDASVEGKPLSIGGRRYDRGLGCHARSVIQFRVEAGMQHLHGSVGLDDEANAGGTARFRIFDADRRVLFESAPRTVGEPAVPFDVSLEHVVGDVFLHVDAVNDSVDDAHADWVDVEAVR